MTKITFYKEKNVFLGFEVSGHTGKDDFGKDLLCCQISTVAQLAALAVTEVEKLNAFVEIADGYLKVKVKPADAQKEKIKYLFDVCYKSFQSIIQDEQRYAKLEVKNV